MMIKLALLIAIYCVIMLFPRVFSRASAQETEGAELPLPSTMTISAG
jgi:hypothetical protein